MYTHECFKYSICACIDNLNIKLTLKNTSNTNYICAYERLKCNIRVRRLKILNIRVYVILKTLKILLTNNTKYLYHLIHLHEYFKSLIYACNLLKF